MIPVPEHLSEIAILNKRIKNTLIMSLQCSKCKGVSFFLYENCPSKEEKQLLKQWRNALRNWYPSAKDGFPGKMTQDESGVWHYWKILSADGQKKEEVIMPEQPLFATIQVIKAVCCECGQEYILFDSRFCGYDGVVSEHSADKVEYIPQYKQKSKVPMKIEIKVENDGSFDEFIENSGVNLNEKQYSNAYSWIKISGIDNNGKKKNMFESETA